MHTTVKELPSTLDMCHKTILRWKPEKGLPLTKMVKNWRGSTFQWDNFVPQFLAPRFNI